MSRISILFLGILILITSCNEAPEFPNTPKIEFNNIIFKDVSQEADSLIVYIDFEDGDGDLGLGTEELAPPFNEKNYFSNKTGKLFDFDSETSEDLLVLSNRSTIDSLPPFFGDSKCLNWDTDPELFFTDGSQFSDTVYFQFNDRHNNFIVDWFVDSGSGLDEFNWRLELDCSTDYNGRFPSLNNTGKAKPLQGTIKYAMASFGFKSILQDKTIKLKIRIIDRSGNYSNTIETPPFKLSEID